MSTAPSTLTATFDSYMEQVEHAHASAPEKPRGRHAYDVLVKTAPRLAFTVTDDRNLNPCFDQTRVPAFLAFVEASLR